MALHTLALPEAQAALLDLTTRGIPEQGPFQSFVKWPGGLRVPLDIGTTLTPEARGTLAGSHPNLAVALLSH